VSKQFHTTDETRRPIPRDHDQQEKPKLLLTVTEAGELLGIKRTLMYELISTGAIPTVLIGRLRRIRPADLESASLATVRPNNPTSHAA
jgi:excisionase family DNA binding protein